MCAREVRVRIMYIILLSYTYYTEMCIIFLTIAAGHDVIWISRFGSESVTISPLLRPGVFLLLRGSRADDVHTRPRLSRNGRVQ